MDIMAMNMAIPRRMIRTRVAAITNIPVKKQSPKKLGIDHLFTYSNPREIDNTVDIPGRRLR